MNLKLLFLIIVIWDSCSETECTLHLLINLTFNQLSHQLINNIILFPATQTLDKVKTTPLADLIMKLLKVFVCRRGTSEYDAFVLFIFYDVA